MSEFLILECSRQSGRKSYSQVDEDQDVFKNSWVNSVSTSGIQINRGDIIQLEQSAINTSGTIQNSIEIVGNDRENDIKDNKFSMDVEFYINHSGFNGIPLPIRSFDNYCSDISNDFTLLKNARNRGLGEILPTFGQFGFLNNFSISVKDGGTGFQQNGLYTASSDFSAHPTNQDLTFRAIQVQAGELILAELVDITYNINTQLGAIFDCYPAQGTSGTPNPTAFATISVATGDKDLTTTNFIEPDNRRYYPAQGDFSGVAYKTAPSAPTWTTNLNPTFRPRYKTINVEIEEGLNSASSIATEITKQIQNSNNESILSQPRTYADLTDQSLAFESQSTSIWAVNKNENTTPYKDVLLNPDRHRKLIYGQIAYENPQKYEGLQFSRQFYYGADNNDVLNEINSGNNLLASSGDYHTQSVGDHGLNMTMTNYFTNVSGLIEMGANNIITTNVYFTEANIAKIASGFKIAEVNCGLYFTSSTDKLDMGVPLDVGLYLDKQSQATLVSPPVVSKRNRFITGKEAIVHTPANIYTTTDQGFEPAVSTNYGTQYPYFDGDVSKNDGQQLSQLVVRSRYVDAKLSQLNGCLVKLKTPNEPTDFKVDASRSVDDVFFGQGYQDLIALSKKYDVACIPVFPDVSSGEWFKHGGRPYIAFISKLPCSQTNTDVYDQNTQTGWKIDSKNFFPSIQLGLDTSFIRNRGLQMINNTRQGSNSSLQGVIVAGAYNLQFQFDNNTSKFYMDGMNTNLKDGNGQAYENTEILEFQGLVSETPEQQVFGLNTNKQCFTYFNRDDDGFHTFDINMKSNPKKIIDSITGVSLRSLYLYDANGNVKITQNYYDDTLQSLDNSLLDKMGFEMNQFFNLEGTIQTRFKTDTTNTTINDRLKNNTRPLTQNAIVGVPEINACQVNGTLPLFGTGIGIPSTQVFPQTTQNRLLATNLPSQLDYPYLVVYSSIIREGTLSKYIGGNNSQQLLNAMGYITRYNNEGSFFYGSESSFQYTATKDFVLSEITTDIKLPDGSRPRLDKNSSVIYKVIKPLPLLPAFVPLTKKDFDINDIYAG